MKDDNLVTLATAILDTANVLAKYLEQQKLPKPSFEKDDPIFSGICPNHTEAWVAHQALLETTRRLHLLALGPAGILRYPSIDYVNHPPSRRRVLTVASEAELQQIDETAAIQTIYHFGIANHVPIDGYVSFHELAQRCSLPVPQTKIILRFAMTCFIFHEPKPGFVAHTAASKLLVGDGVPSMWVSIGLEEKLPAALKLVEALEKYSDSQEPSKSAWGLAHNAQAHVYEELATRHPRRAHRFASLIHAISETVPPSAVCDGYDWSSLGMGYGTKTVVDVGGGKGLVSKALAYKFPKLKFIVQDLHPYVDEGRRELPNDLKDRVRFQEHNFLSTQPVVGADVYFFRAVFHNFSDKYCIRILRNLIPALKKGARIILNEPYMPPALSMPPGLDRARRLSDFNMMLFYNSRDRESHEWGALFGLADRRFKLIGVRTPHVNVPRARGQAFLGLIEAEWTG